MADLPWLRHLGDAHQGHENFAQIGKTKLEDLKPLTLFVSKEGVASYFQWLKSEYGFSEDKIKPYTFNAQPFLADASWHGRGNGSFQLDATGRNEFRLLRRVAGGPDAGRA